MGAASIYWRFLSIDAAGRRKSEQILTAKAFFQQQFPQFIAQPDVPDASIQRQLLQISSNPDTTNRLDAQMCLRCFISSQIEQTCIQLESQFGENHGFTRYDLFPFVLDDVIVASPRSSYQSLAIEILQTFNPERGNLSTWTNRLVKHHRELNSFLLEHGVYLVSDWAILNDTNSKQLQRIFLEFHHLTPAESQQASTLLESYHAVYRRDRLASRMSKVRGQCPLPTVEQLQRIAQIFHLKANESLSAEDVMNLLQDIAELLRQYRIHVRGGAPPTESLDNSDNRVTDAINRVSTSADDEDDNTDFLRFYRRQFIDCLDQSLDKVISDRVTKLTRKNDEMAQQFTNALHLFHCQGQSMGAIAPLVGLQAQYQVTRLLKLKEFRADVRQYMLNSLLRSILDKATSYTNPKRLKTLEKQVETALEEQISAAIQEVENESAQAKNRPLSSLFAQRLCRQLKT